MVEPLTSWYYQNKAEGPPPGSALPRSPSYMALHNRASQLLGAAAHVDSAADKKVAMAATAFEVSAVCATVRVWVWVRVICVHISICMHACVPVCCA